MDDFGSVSSLIESVGTAENLVQLNSIIKKFAPHVGIQNLGLLYRKITSGTPWQIPPQIGIANLEYRALYIAESLITTDPFKDRAEKTALPFYWTLSQETKKVNKITSRFFELHHEMKFRQGIMVPVYSPGRITSVGMTMGGTEKEFKSSLPVVMPIIHLFALHVADAATRVVMPDQATETSIPLTKRERECLCWLASGKTAWEIGQILNITETTVIFHTENIKRKLGARNTVQAIYLALKQSLID
jgi:DNA-binding CsgD family transcriptional regulator